MFFFECLIVFLPMLISAGFFTLFERKVMGSMQFREGPSKIVVLGFFQPLSDAFKLFSKSNLSSEVSMDFVFFFSPLLMFFISCLSWVVFPLAWNILSWYTGFLFVLFCFSVSVYGLILSGWFSCSKFASLGCVRALSQSISYEIPLAVGILVYILVFSSFSLGEVGEFQEMVNFFFPFFFLLIMFLIVFLAEMNRSPFDLAEGESELVSGFSVEFGSVSFVTVFLGEYVSLIWMSLLVSLMFFGEVGLFLGFKMILVMFIFVWVRSSVLRVRFDSVMMVSWVSVLPLVLTFMFVSVSMI